MIGNAFSDIVQKVGNPKITYEWFDFHHECRKMQYDNIGKLIDLIKVKMASYDYFMAQLEHGLIDKSKLDASTIMIQCYQVGVIRTNCIDCLDRTNVV